jgi:hypothetical protein
MVDFETFTELARDGIAEHLPEVNISSINIDKVNKVNTEFTCMSIVREGESVAPNIYLDGFYDRYTLTGDLDETISEMADAYKAAYQKIPNNLPHFEGKDYILGNVYVSLVNKAMNEEMLEKGPYIDIDGMPDIAGVFRVRLYMNGDEGASFRMTDTNMSYAGITQEELEGVALENTRKLFPTVIMTIEDSIRGTLTQDELDEMPVVEESGLYVITNKFFSEGASAVLDKDKVAELADKLGNNLMLIPSSINEFLAVADNGNIEAEKMAEMVEEINRNVVRLDERLSDNVFLFDRQTREYSQLTNSDRRLDEKFSDFESKVI